MPDIANFAGANYQQDLLPPATARSALALIQGLQNTISSLNLQGLINTFNAHVANLDNPHELTYSDFPQTLLASLWTHYSATLPSGTALTYPVFLQAITQDPTAIFEVMRRLILNDLSYQDRVGKVATPVYQFADISVQQPPTFPQYFASVASPDWFMAVVPNFNNPLVAFSQTIPEAAYNQSWLFGINPSNNGGTNPVQICLNNAQNYQLLFSISSTGALTINVNPSSDVVSLIQESDIDPTSVLAFSFNNITLQLTAPYVFSVMVTQNSVSIYYQFNGNLYTVTLGLNNGFQSPLTTYSVLQGMQPVPGIWGYLRTIALYSLMTPLQLISVLTDI